MPTPTIAPIAPLSISAVQTHYTIEWLVPAQNAIGGTAYWSPMKLPIGALARDYHQAQEDFATAQVNHPRDKLRIVKTVQKVLKTFPTMPKNDGFTGSMKAPPFTIEAFTDAHETECVGTYIAHRWEEAQAVAQTFLDHADFVVVTDQTGSPIEPDCWV